MILLCPSKNTGVGFHFLLQGSSPALAGKFFTTEPPGKPPSPRQMLVFISYLCEHQRRCQWESTVIKDSFTSSPFSTQASSCSLAFKHQAYAGSSNFLHRLGEFKMWRTSPSFFPNGPPPPTHFLGHRGLSGEGEKWQVPG